MKLLKKLQECSTIGQADPILTKLGAGPAVKKLVETAIILNNSQDPQQRSHAYSFMESAIRELEGGADGTVGSAPNEMGKFGNEDGLNNHQISEQKEDDDDIEHKLVHEQEDDDKEHSVKEEVLDNHNNGPREDGSEQSTENEEPYPGTALDSTNGEKPMQDMDGTINQWNETGGMPPGAGMGQPPMGGPPQMTQQPPMGNMPGLAPDVAQEMGMIMPEIPPFNTNQMMRQMQYTVDSVVKDLYRKQIAPLHRILKHQKEIQRQQKHAITSLSQELRETKANNGNMKLDLDSMRRNAGAKFRETTNASELQNFATFDRDGLPGVQPVRRQQVKLESARSEIEQMNKMLNSANNPMYS